MKSRSLGILTLTVAILTVIWLALLLAGELATPPAVTLAGRVAAIEEQPTLFALNYANAGLLTLACVAMLGGYYVHLRQNDPLWTAVAILFAPIYGLINVVVYLSQVVVIPQLLTLYRQPETALLGETWLGLTLHTWPGSAAGFFNALAYAILAVPSIIFGLLLARRAHGPRLGGLLLIASGLLSIVALTGFVTGAPLLTLMSPTSGFLFLLALLLLSRHFLRPSQPTRNAPVLGSP